MKKTAYIILFVLLILQSGGLIFLLQVKQSHIQYKMERALNEDKADLQKMTLSLIELENARVGSNEISLNGKMYDVKSITTKGDFAELLVLEDSEEGALLRRLKELLKEKQQEGALFQLNYKNTFH
ncbi:MAG: hypothetical protein IPP51_17425 [Bacteroidetes bacterium]|nr:hypothetical protein [Bacteroidota bacterium]